jgi:hypothetical protein
MRQELLNNMKNNLSIGEMVQGVELVSSEGDVYTVQGTMGECVFIVNIYGYSYQHGIRELNSHGYTIKEKIWSTKDLKVGQQYWYVDSGGTVEYSQFNDDYIDQWRIASGNCFQDKKSAEDYKESVLEKKR